MPKGESEMHRPKFFFLLALSFVLLLTACTHSKLPTGGSAIVIESPAPGSAVFSNDTIDVKVKAACGSGVERVELWVNGAAIGRADAPQGSYPKELPVTFKWMPTSAGTYSLEARGYCHDGTQPSPFPLVISVAPKTAEASPTPAPPTSTPPAAAAATKEPTATKKPDTPVPSVPSLVAAVDLNVRTGPGTDYPKVGVLQKGNSAVITGKDPTGAWWQIEFPADTGRRGWVAAAYVSPSNVENVQVADVPPIPSEAPGTTPAPPTAVPTSPPEAGEGAAFQANFWSDKASIFNGQCTNLHWDVEGVQAVYLEGAGVAGHGSKQVCPSANKTYTLHIVKSDGTAEDRHVTINVLPSLSLPTPVFTLKPDLIVSSFTSKPNPHCGDSYWVHITVKNVGNVAAGSFKVYYYWSSSAPSPMRQSTVSGLNAGATWSTSYSFTFTCSSQQTRHQRAVVDAENQVPESNESNNSKDLTTIWTP